jgi:biotin synthase
MQVMLHCTDRFRASEPTGMLDISPREALNILKTPGCRIDSLLELSCSIRTTGLRDGISFCSIINAKSGNCSEDCSFCAQSSTSTAPHRNYPLLENHLIKAARKMAEENGAEHFSIVTSGCWASQEDIESICETISSSGNDRPIWCASLGILSLEQLQLLKAAGLGRYHHNIETDRSFFREICSTHTWLQRVNTIKSAKLSGLEVCSGGIIGLGESLSQRVSMAFQLRELDVDSIALNFLIPLEGTGAGMTLKPLPVDDILKTIVMFRLVCPDSELRLCAGRQYLGSYEEELLRAGITGIMTGDLLTTCGPDRERDTLVRKAAERLRVDQNVRI